MRVLVAGYQHETNTFAPTLASWDAFTRGDSFPAYVRGNAMTKTLSGINIPVAGFLDAAKARGWTPGAITVTPRGVRIELLPPVAAARS